MLQMMKLRFKSKKDFPNLSYLNPIYIDTYTQVRIYDS